MKQVCFHLKARTFKPRKLFDLFDGCYIVFLWQVMIGSSNVTTKETLLAFPLPVVFGQCGVV